MSKSRAGTRQLGAAHKRSDNARDPLNEAPVRLLLCPNTRSFPPCTMSMSGRVTVRREAAAGSCVAVQSGPRRRTRCRRPPGIAGQRAAEPLARNSVAVFSRPLRHGPVPRRDSDRAPSADLSSASCRPRPQLVEVRGHQQQTRAWPGQAPDQRPSFAGLVTGAEAAAMGSAAGPAHWPAGRGVVYVQRAARPVAEGKAPYPDHVEPAGKNGPRRMCPMAAPLPVLRSAAFAAQRAAHDDHQAGQGKQRDNGGDGAGREPRSPSASEARSTRSDKYPTITAAR